MSASSSRSLSYPHLAWSAGHALVVVASIWEAVSVCTFHSAPRAHKMALFGALLSWGIVVFKSLGVPTASRAYLQRALMDENAQYLILALGWYLQKPIALTILPYATFSIFHILTFIRTTFLPKVSPASAAKDKATPPPSGGLGVQASKTIQSLVKKHYENAMLFVSFVEIGIMVRVTFGALIFKNSFLIPFFYATFLRLRYYLSPATRKAFAAVNSQIDHAISNPKCPPSVKNGVNVARDMVIRFSESAIISAPQTGAAQAAASAPPAGGAR